MQSVPALAWPCRFLPCPALPCLALPRRARDKSATRLDCLLVSTDHTPVLARLGLVTSLHGALRILCVLRFQFPVLISTPSPASSRVCLLPIPDCLPRNLSPVGLSTCRPLDHSTSQTHPRACQSRLATRPSACPPCLLTYLPAYLPICTPTYYYNIYRSVSFRPSSSLGRD